MKGMRTDHQVFVRFFLQTSDVCLKQETELQKNILFYGILIHNNINLKFFR